jgi:hypothetical protein
MVLFSRAIVRPALLTVALLACSRPPSLEATPPPTLSSVTPLPTRPLGVAIPVGSPTATAEPTGDLVSVARPQVSLLRQDFGQLDQQLAAAQASPIRMAQDDWRNQTQAVLQELLSASSDLRTTANRFAGKSALDSDLLKLTDDVDFVATEFNMALTFDPDSTHFIRAARAERTTVEEVDSILARMH